MTNPSAVTTVTAAAPNNENAHSNNSKTLKRKRGGCCKITLASLQSAFRQSFHLQKRRRVQPQSQQPTAQRVGLSSPLHPGRETKRASRQAAANSASTSVTPRHPLEYYRESVDARTSTAVAQLRTLLGGYHVFACHFATPGSLGMDIQGMELATTAEPHATLLRARLMAPSETNSGMNTLTFCSVAGVVPNSLSEQAGIRPNDYLLVVSYNNSSNGRMLLQPEFAYIRDAAGKQRPLTFVVLRELERASASSFHQQQRRQRGNVSDDSSGFSSDEDSRKETYPAHNEKTKKIPVNQYKGSRLIASFSSVNAAFLATKIGRQAISMCCRGQLESVEGYTWKYGTEVASDANGAASSRKVEGRTASSRKGETVEQWDGDEKIAFYETISAAAQATGISRGTISACARGGRTDGGGFVWTFAGNASRKAANRNKKPGGASKVVLQYDGDRLVNTWASMTDAEVTGTSRYNIAKCCEGKRNTAGGFSWRFANPKDSVATAVGANEKRPEPKPAAAVEKVEVRPESTRSTIKEPDSTGQGPIIIRGKKRAGGRARVVEQWKGDQLVALYESMSVAEEKTKISRHHIAACCEGRQDDAGGYHWQFADAEQSADTGRRGTQTKSRTENNGNDSDNKTSPSKNIVGEITGKANNSHTKAVEQRKNGKLIAVYASMRIAADRLGLDSKRISSVCRGKRAEEGGFVWRYADMSEAPVPDKPVSDTSKKPVRDAPKKPVSDAKKPVRDSKKPAAAKSRTPQARAKGKDTTRITTAKSVQQWKGEKLVATFDSLTDAQDAIGISRHDISRCCRGDYETAGGFVWKFA